MNNSNNDDNIYKLNTSADANSTYTQQEQPYAEGALQTAGLNSFLLKIFLWMFVGLAFTFGVSFSLMQGVYASNYFVLNLLDAVFNNYFMYVLFHFALVFILSAAINKMPAIIATIMFFVYSASTGILIFPAIMYYDSVLLALAITSSVFLIMAVYGYTTKADLSKAGSMLMVGLFAIIFASLINFWLRSPALDYILCYAGILVFLGLTAYDVNKLKEVYIANSANMTKQTLHRLVIIGALTLYLDFINLFLRILQLFGRD